MTDTLQKKQARRVVEAHARKNDPHGDRGYTDDQLATHEALQADPDNVHGTKAYADAGDSAVQANLDAHIAVTDIHFSDAPADGFLYGRKDNAWARRVVELGVLYGVPSSFTLGLGRSSLVNWGDSGSTAPGITVDAVAGTIALTEPGGYELVTGLVGIQGNDTKEEDIYLWLEWPGNDLILWSYHIGTDKGLNYRSLGRTLVVGITAPTTYNLTMSATSGLGTFTFDSANFSISRVL